MLRSSVGHLGDNPNMGHFTAVVHNNADSLWYMCNDHKVSGGHQRISLTRRSDGVSAVFPEGVTPYILFYQKIGVELPPQAPVSQIDHPPSVRQGPPAGDSPETQAVRAELNITPKRRQVFPPQSCKLCGVNTCHGACLQRL